MNFRRAFVHIPGRGTEIAAIGLIDRFAPAPYLSSGRQCKLATRTLTIVHELSVGCAEIPHELRQR